MDANEVLSKAWSAVQASGVPESLYEVAFKEAVALLLPGRSVAPVPAASAPVPLLGEGEEVGAIDGSPDIDTDALLRRFAEESNVALTELMEVFYFEADGTPHLNVPGRKLGDSTAAKAKAIATAIAAAYFFTSDEPSVSVETIRAECACLKCVDPKNFSTQMGSAPGTISSGTGANRVLRVKPNEIEAALRSVVSIARKAKD